MQFYNAMQMLRVNMVASTGKLYGNSGVEVGNVLMDNATGAILGFVGDLLWSQLRK